MNSAYLISAIVIVIGLTAASHALLNKRDSKAAFAWIAFCLVLPLIGPLIYLIFGINRVQQRALKNYFAKLEIDDSPSIFEPQDSDFHPLSLVGENVTGKGLRSCDSVTLLENGEQLYPEMLEAIDAASSKIYLSSYIFDNDETGEKFINALHNAQSRGVEVRVVIDALGEYMSFPRVGRKLQLRDLKFLRFNPITLIPPAIHINLRNHRKILIVDSKVAFTGGQNIGNRHLGLDLENEHRVIDLHFKLTGKVVDELERAFLRDWHTAHGKEDETPFEPANKNKSESQIWTRLVLDGPNEYFDRLNDLLVGIISSAQKRVWIMTPYFLPGPDIAAALLGARLRGIDIRILLPAQNNIFLIRWAHYNIAPYFVEKNIKLYFQPAPFVHTKAIIIDDNYSLVGSSNLDARSLRLNFELCVEVFDSQLNSQLTQYFEEKISRAQLMSMEQLKAIPLIKRMRNALAWLFSPYL